MVDQRLRQVKLFADLDESDLVRVCEGVQSLTLEPGQTLFAEGDPGDTAYVVADGEVEIVKAVGQRETLLAVRRAGDVIGEMALLQEEPRSATVRARGDVELLTIPKKVLDALFETSPAAVRSTFDTLLDRLTETNNRLRQSDRMAQLGTLTAGVAHELNNPAAGANRAAERITEAFDGLSDALVEAGTLEPGLVVRIVAAAREGQPAPLDPLARSDAESAVEAWLELDEIDDAWRLAPALVDAGIGVPVLRELTEGLDPDAVNVAIRLLVGLALPRRLAGDVVAGTKRISEIVGRLKTHSYLDRAPVVQVDLHQGLDDTIALMRSKLEGIDVVREYGDDVPTIEAAGGAVNDVWMNLVDNAAYALHHADVAAPRITLRTRRAGADVEVEVEDNGPGVADEIRDRIFDAFATTKPPGEGTGQGLNLSYSTVVLEHQGELTVDSRPGRTVFRVVLPITRRD